MCGDRLLSGERRIWDTGVGWGRRGALRRPEWLGDLRRRKRTPQVKGSQAECNTAGVGTRLCLSSTAWELCVVLAPFKLLFYRATKRVSVVTARLAGHTWLV